MDLTSRKLFLAVSMVFLVSLTAGYANTDNVKVYRGEKVQLGDYSFSYDTVGGDRFEIMRRGQGSSYILKQAEINKLYDEKGEKFDYPEAELSVVFEGMEWSNKGSYLNLTVSSEQNIFTDASLNADVPQRVIGARGDEIKVPLTLKNKGTRNNTYNLSYNTSEGVSISYNYQGFNVSKIEVPAGESFEIDATVEILESAKAGETFVSFKAISDRETSEEIEIEVRGSEKTRELEFELEQNYVTTWPGKEFSISPEIRNTGDAPVENLDISLELPENWELVRDRDQDYEVLERYDRAHSYYRVRVPGNVESGDYYITVDPESENLDPESKRIRVHVRTKSGLSYIGVGLIVVSLLGMGGTYWKLGRR